jgi:hypothetical protein
MRWGSVIVELDGILVAKNAAIPGGGLVDHEALLLLALEAISGKTVADKAPPAEASLSLVPGLVEFGLKGGESPLKV